MVPDLHIAQYVPGITSPSLSIHFNKNTFLSELVSVINSGNYMPAVSLFIIAGQHFRKNRVSVFDSW